MDEIISRFIERFYPFLIALAVIIGLHFFKINEITINRFDVFINSLITSSVTVIGFIITIITILIGILDREIIKKIDEKKGTNLLVEYLLVPIIFGFLIIIDSFVLGNIIGESGYIGKKLFYFSTFIIVVFLLSLFRMSYILLLLFKKIGHEYTEQHETDVHSVPEDAINSSDS